MQAELVESFIRRIMTLECLISHTSNLLSTSKRTQNVSQVSGKALGMELGYKIKVKYVLIICKAVGWYCMVRINKWNE